MSKEEFLSMLNVELENLEREAELARRRIKYFESIGEQRKEVYQEALYQFRIVQTKIDALRKILLLPALARIQAMSDVEIEEYKKSKNEELELKIKEIESRKEQAKAKLAQLKAEQDQIIAQFGTIDRDKREELTNRGKRIFAEIERYDINNRYGVFAQLQAEIAEVRKQQEQLERMTSQEIKKQLLSQKKESVDKPYKKAQLEELIDLLSNNPTHISMFTELASEVGLDFTKAKQLAELLSHYADLSKEQEQPSVRIDLPSYLPDELRRRLTEYPVFYNSRTNEVLFPDKLMEIISEFEASFAQAKAVFMEQFTAQKLDKLIKLDISAEVDIEFLKLHSDKIGASKLEHLQTLVQQRDKLSKKIFKSKKIKSDIDELNKQIRKEKDEIYNEIRNWYKSQIEDFKHILGAYCTLSDDLKSWISGLEQCKSNFDKCEQAITSTKENLQQAKTTIEQKRREQEAEKSKNLQQTLQQIRALGSEKYKETNMPNYVPTNDDENLDQIIGAQGQVYQRDIISRVLQEAQNQADIREAELKGITVEQLLQMRQQSQALADEPIATEEVSQGMKM